MDVQSLSHESLYIGATPILDSFIDRLGLESLLQAYVPPDPRHDISPATVILTLVRNFAIDAHPLYAFSDWLGRFVPEALALSQDQVNLFNDDRLARILDRLFFADRASLVTEIAVNAVKTFHLNLDHLLNDSTTLTFSGQYRERPPKAKRKAPAHITYGFNKDHRPDLKQLVLSLSLTADGFIPIHYRLLDGNTTDDSTHIDTWKALCALRNSPDFLYVADSKLCTKDNLAFIAAQGGRFISVLPRTRAEDRHFKDLLQTPAVSLHEVLNTEHPRTGELEFYYHAHPTQTSADGFSLLWFFSSAKYELDCQRRKDAIDAAISALKELIPKVGARSLKTKAEIEDSVQALLTRTGACRWIKPVLKESTRESFKQAKPGRPGKDTAYIRVIEPVFELSFALDDKNIAYDAKTDGYFPLITNIPNPEPRQILQLYKKQAFLEKRHEQLKTVLEIAPVYLKTPERIEAYVFIYFLALLLHAVIERTLRQEMARRDLSYLPIYPERRECEKPTAQTILGLFESIRRHRLMNDGQPVATFFDPLTDAQQTVLELLGIPLNAFRH